MVLPDDGTGYLLTEFGLDVSPGLHKLHPEDGAGGIETYEPDEEAEYQQWKASQGAN